LHGVVFIFNILSLNENQITYKQSWTHQAL